MTNVWLILYGTTLAAESIMLWLFCNLFFDYKHERYNWLLLPIALIICLFIQQLGVWLDWPERLGSVAYFALDCIVLRLLFDIRLFGCLAVVSIFYAVAAALDSGVLVTLEWLWNLPRVELLADGYLLICMTVIARLLLIFLTQTLPRKLFPRRLYISNARLIGFAVIPLGSAYLVAGCLPLCGMPPGEVLELPLIVLLVWWLNLVNALYFHYLERLRQRYLNTQGQLDLLAGAEQYYRRLEHFSRQLDKRVHNLQHLYGHIEDVPIWTGNRDVDLVLNCYIGVAKELAITFGISGKLAPDLPVEAEDMQILLGNLLQNAVEACELAAEPRWIQFQAQQEVQGVVFKVANTTRQGLNLSAWQPSSKRPGSRLGYGQETIREIVHKYGGEVAVKSKDGIYSLRLVLAVLEKGEHEDDHGKGEN